MHYFVINLDRSPVRLASVKQNFDRYGLEFQRIPAVDGSQLTAEQIAAVYDPERNRRQFFTPLKTTEIACFMSHQRAWQLLLDSGLDYVVIVEDDIEWIIDPREVNQELDVVLRQPGGQIIKLFHKRTAGDASRASLANRTITRPIISPLGMVAYALNREAAQRLLVSTRVFWEPVDVLVQRWWYTNVKVHHCIPSIVREVSAKLGGTTLHRAQKQPSSEKIKREAKRPFFRVRRSIESLVRAVLARSDDMSQGS